MTRPADLQCVLDGQSGWLSPAPGVRLHAGVLNVMTRRRGESCVLPGQRMAALLCLAVDALGQPRATTIFSRS